MYMKNWWELKKEELWQLMEGKHTVWMCYLFFFITVVNTVCMIVCFMSLQHISHSVAQQTIVSTTSQEEQLQDKSTLVVDIKGEIHSPGVYQMEQGDRVIDVVQKAGGFTEDARQESVNLSQKLVDQLMIIIPNQHTDRESEETTKKLNINTASAEELMKLEGIGKTKAEQIVQYRKANGPFQTIDDLKHITGIGSKTIDALKEKITVLGE